MQLMLLHAFTHANIAAAQMTGVQEAISFAYHFQLMRSVVLLQSLT